MRFLLAQVCLNFTKGPLRTLLLRQETTWHIHWLALKPANMSGPIQRNFYIGALILVGVATAIYFWDQEAFLAWTENLNPWAFFLLMAITPAFGVPTSPFYILAGLSFGPLLGLGGSALAIAANLLLVYAIGHSGLRRVINKMLEGREFQLPQQAPRRPIRYTVLVKFAPGVPAFLKNYILVLSKISLPLYFGISFVFSFIYALMFYVLGGSIEEQQTGQGVSVLVALLILAAVGWYVRRRLIQKKNEDTFTEANPRGH